MSLTFGTGPFGPDRRGRFDFVPPEHVVFAEPFPRRVRAALDDRIVVDSDDVLMIHQTGRLPHYAFPAGDVHVAAAPEPHAVGYVTVAWEAVDGWYEEDERIEVHPRDPYHRIDTLSTSRRITVVVNGTRLADSTSAAALYETGLPTRWYLPIDDVRLDLLEESSTVTECAYKGTARHWSARLGTELVEDVAWSYGHATVRPDGERVRDRIAFYDERVDLEVDGVRQARPATRWSRIDS
ncbi:MAG: DUF427 domain-containing protein [Dehalococcoidia bacterium]